ncbi:DNA excision repair protein ERCC-4 [Strigomonas culicis]|nr:DNA excision repair protein ERCC-4 [Strigomonas culicis]|eukprot:EPY23542.1 DNA excision repair protein ERCC-4 [Strigomonas culicis]
MAPRDGKAPAGPREPTMGSLPDDDTMFLRPRAKHKYESTADRALPVYAHKPWRCGGSGKIILFRHVSEEAAVDVTTKDLDVDLALALRANDGAWPFRQLAESLLDVRQLLRVARYGTKYSFFLLLARLLEEKARPVAAIGGLSRAPPQALWTLSSHFSDVLTVATHRIGEVSESPPAASASDLNVVSVDEEDEDVQFLGAKSAASQAPAATKHICPNLTEPDPVLDITHRVVCSWTLRRLRSAPPAETAAPAMVVVVFGGRERFRVENRLRFVREDFAKFEFNRFVEAYQERYGVVIEKKSRAPPSALAGDDDGMDKPTTEREDDACVMGAYITDPAMTFGSGDDDGMEEEGVGGQSIPLRFTQSIPTKPVTDLNFPLHQALIAAGSQMSVSQEIQKQKSVVVFNDVQARTDRVTVLRPSAFTTNGDVHTVAKESTDTPLLFIVDLFRWTTGEFLELLRGSAPHLGSAGSVLARAPAGPFVVQRVLLTQKHIGAMRLMETCQDELPASVLRRLKVQLVSNSLSDADFKRSILQERDAFEALAHVKANLTGALLASRGSLRLTEQQLESGLALAAGSSSRRRGDLTQRALAPVGTDAAPPMIIVDERDFRSTLPYALYARGIDIVPLTLVTGDYVLSPDCAVERKSVRDYLMSLSSRRIYHQLSALCRRFKHPILLIEFQRHQPFRLAFSSDRGACTDAHSLTNLYTDTAKLLAAFPTVRVMWARSPAHTAAMFHTLKKGLAKENADPSSTALTTLGMDAFSEVATAEAEKVHYAKRVLLRFPGVNPQNMDAVMRAAGTLAGLASISLEALQTAMGNENAKLLFDFIHSSFNIDVD